MKKIALVIAMAILSIVPLTSFKSNLNDIPEVESYAKQIIDLAVKGDVEGYNKLTQLNDSDYKTFIPEFVNAQKMQNRTEKVDSLTIANKMAADIQADNLKLTSRFKEAVKTLQAASANSSNTKVVNIGYEIRKEEQITVLGARVTGDILVNGQLFKFRMKDIVLINGKMWKGGRILIENYLPKNTEASMAADSAVVIEEPATKVETKSSNKKKTTGSQVKKKPTK